ncbi:MAG: helix-turn-helix transcriptional regulator [Bacteroidales bacterium]|nr:helix-turn-helix transcriptional regulator [Bacteroidales bacterium]
MFQRIFAAVLVMHSFGFFNNFVMLACQNLSNYEYINTLLILYDYMTVGGYMMFAVSLVFPNRYNIRQLLLLEIPFIIATLFFAFSGNPIIYPVIQIYTLAASSVLLVCLLISIKKYTQMLENDVGNMDYFDLRWSSILLVTLFAVQLLWAFESFSQQTWFSVSSADRNLLFDTCYCFLSLVFVIFFTVKIVRQQVYILTPEENNFTENNAIKKDNPNIENLLTDTSHSSPYHEILLDMNIENIIRDKQYYMETDLTLQKLARYLGTNRQYLSNYINQEKHKTFYEYINDFRLEEAKKLLEGDNSDHSYSIEEIGSISGFNSYATFLRSFKKKYGQSPTDYLKNRA